MEARLKALFHPASPDRRRFSPGFAPRVIALVALTALLSGGVVGLLGVRSSRSALEEQILRDSQSEAGLAASFMERYVLAAERTLANLAAHAKVQAAVRGEGLIDIERDVAGFPSTQLSNVAVFDRRGDSRLGTIAIPNIADREWFQTVLNTGQFYVGLPVIGRGSGQPVVPVAVPVRSDAGELIGVAAGSISLETLAQDFGFPSTGARTKVTLVDRRQGGVVLTSSDASLILQPFVASGEIVGIVMRGEPATRASANGQDEERLVAVTPVSDTPWTVVVEHPAEAAFAPVGKLTRETVLIIGPVILVACLVSAAFALQVSRPLGRMRRAVQGLAAGDLRRRLDVNQGGEVGELGRAFNLMAKALEERTRDLELAVASLKAEVEVRQRAEAQLQAARDELEERVVERTADLDAANKALRESEELFKLQVEGARDYAIIMLGADGRVATWTSAAEKVHGFTAEEVVGQHFSLFFTPEERTAGIPERLLESAQAEGSASDEGWRLRKDGSRLWASVVLTAIHGEDGKLRGFSRMLRDMTEKKVVEESLQRSEQRFRSIVELSADGIIIADAGGRIQRANGAATMMFGYEEEELAGKRVEDLLPASLRGTHAKHRASFYADPRPRPMGVSLPLRGRRKDGSEFPAEVSLTPLQTQQGFLIAATTRDITERKRAEEELQRRAAELARSNAELEQFAYVASHDLQEPLRMVSNYTQLLGRRYQGKLDEDADTFIGFAVEGANRMRELIDDLLEFARVNTKGREFQPVETASALERTLQNLRATLKETGARVEYDALPSVLGDDVQLAQLFQNLVGNAIKFRGAEPPHVRIWAERDGPDWRFAVRDNGIGIDPPYWERIFVIFQRLHNRSDYPGTGIGLALCKRIVERHSGRIWLESAPGEGATFYFTLPAASILGRAKGGHARSVAARKAA